MSGVSRPTSYGHGAARAGTTECAPLFLRGLYGTIRRHGLFDTVYLDQGPGFIAIDTADVIQRLGPMLVLGSVGYPAGRGKIEKLNQTALAAVLRTLDGNEEVDSDCGALELRLGHWLREVYNHTPPRGARHRRSPGTAGRVRRSPSAATA